MSNRFALTRRIVLGSSVALAAAGCSDMLGPPAAPRLYLLRPPLPAPTTDRLPGVLAIAMPDADAEFDTDRIAIQQPGAILDYYADAAWPDHVPVLVRAALVEAFEAEGAIDTVSGDLGGLAADYALVTEIRDFEARYAVTDGIPLCVIRIDVHLVDQKKRSSLASFVASAEKSAARNSIEAAVAGFNAALGDVLGDIVRKTRSAIANQ